MYEAQARVVCGGLTDTWLPRVAGHDLSTSDIGPRKSTGVIGIVHGDVECTIVLIDTHWQGRTSETSTSSESESSARPRRADLATRSGRPTRPSRTPPSPDASVGAWCLLEAAGAEE